ncbi:MAG: GNAT family N-acetyltransferase [Gammaproteobacteria bacterium]|nr:GNAT family N-acetyltransferase [Gammaproteobacteria bacterium]
MSVSIRDCRYSKADRLWIQSVYGEYLDSLSSLNTGFFPAIGADSPEKDGIFASWFSSEHSHPLVIANGEERVGFALVSRPQIPAAGEATPDYRMAEFFIRAPHRRQGFGRDAATLIFDRFAGEWEVVEYLRNPTSVRFWRRVLADYCRGRFDERSRHGEVRHRFRSRPKSIR